MSAIPVAKIRIQDGTPGELGVEVARWKDEQVAETDAVRLHLKLCGRYLAAYLLPDEARRLIEALNRALALADGAHAPVPKTIDLQALRALALNATRGPWRWMEEEFRQRYMVQTSSGKWRAKPGRRARDSWVFFLAGPLKGGISPEHADEYDYHQVMSLRWSDVRVKELVHVAPLDRDAAFIAACDPQTILRLIALAEAAE